MLDNETEELSQQTASTFLLPSDKVQCPQPLTCRCSRDNKQNGFYTNIYTFYSIFTNFWVHLSQLVADV